MPDAAEATHYLTCIGYYRISGYALPFQKGGTDADRHDFWPDTTFANILDRYVIDRKLRLLVMDAVERIEVVIRAALSNTIAPQHSTRWYWNSALFSPDFNHAAYIADMQRDIGHAPQNA